MPSAEEPVPSDSLFLLLSDSKDCSLETVTELVNEDPSVIWYREPETTMSPLHLAAQRGNLEIVRLLIRSGHPWNAVTTAHVSAGELAAPFAEVYEFLVEEGVRTEFLLSVLDSHERPDNEISNAEYLNSALEFSDGLLLDKDKNGVMMGWESPLMKEHVKIMDPRGKAILNVGFGLGIIDTMIQECEPSRHVIIEAHPDVYKKVF
jgi:protein arginine N-methyltransferase 2